MQVPRSNLWTADEARSDAATKFNVVAHKIAIMNNFMGSPFLRGAAGNDHTFPGGRACRRAFQRTPTQLT
jgi:hypothetical protein